MRKRPTSLPVLATLALAVTAFGQRSAIEDVTSELNRQATVDVKDENKSYQLLFDAYLELDDPPQPVGSSFNLRTIHPGMNGWDEVADWAESSPGMAEAIAEARDRFVLGLPYGRDNVSAAYRAADLVCDIGVNETLRVNEFPYLDALDVMAAYTAAEMYRLVEESNADEAADLMMSWLFVVRQCCDRDFMEEKMRSCQLLSSSLAVFREMLWTHHDKLDAGHLVQLSWWELPYLQPDRARLFMPEADRIISEALIREIFDDRTGEPDPDKFAETFAAIQSKDAPLTRFGAAARWRMIAPVHGSLEASLERLTLIYDDWWRRWRVQEYDAILDVEPQFERTNAVRYAAVIYSMQNIESLFAVRNQLIAEVNATAICCGLCAYKIDFGNFPNDIEKAYAQFMRKRSDSDPFDKQLRPFKYRYIGSGDWAIDTLEGRVWVRQGGCILYSVGQDHEDGGGREHRGDGATEDMVFWPPIGVLQREEGLVD